MDAMVAAGGVPKPDDPLCEYTQGGAKAFLDVAGKPMVQWVLDALSAAEHIEHVVVVGLEPDLKVYCDKPLAFVPQQGAMLANIRAGVRKVLELNPQAEHVIMVSGDVPAIRAEILDWQVETALQSDHDLYYTVVTKEVMETRFPDSRRSYTPLKGMQVCGGDVHIIRASLATREDQIWDELIGARKNVFKQASMIGYSTLLLLLLRRLTIEGAIPRVTKRLGVTGRAVVCPYAEVAMDVDKPHQLELLRKDLGVRASQ
jgi:NDP-sugar pyrophosphorylase family protein